MPQTATRRELWYRVGFSTFVGAVMFTIIASGLVLTTTAEPPFMILLGSLLALRVPYLYWSMRSRYEPITIDCQDGTGQPELRYKGGSGLHGATFWLVPGLMASLDMCTRGDSGGPFFSGGTALGTMALCYHPDEEEAGPNVDDQAIYMAVNYFSGFDLTVLTD